MPPAQRVIDFVWASGNKTNIISRKARNSDPTKSQPRLLRTFLGAVVVHASACLRGVPSPNPSCHTADRSFEGEIGPFARITIEATNGNQQKPMAASKNQRNLLRRAYPGGLIIWNLTFFADPDKEQAHASFSLLGGATWKGLTPHPNQQAVTGCLTWWIQVSHDSR